MSGLLKSYLEEAKARVHLENELNIEHITPPSSQEIPSYLINNEIINQSNNNTTIDTSSQSNINITAANTVEAMTDAQHQAENLIQSTVNISETTSSNVQSNSTTTQQETENLTPSDEKFSDNPSTTSQLNVDSPEIKVKRVKLSHAQEAERQADNINQSDEKSSATLLPNTASTAQNTNSNPDSSRSLLWGPSSSYPGINNLPASLPNQSTAIPNNTANLPTTNNANDTNENNEDDSNQGRPAP